MSCFILCLLCYYVFEFFAVFTVFSNIRTFLTLSNSSVTEIHNTFGHFNFTKFVVPYFYAWNWLTQMCLCRVGFCDSSEFALIEYFWICSLGFFFGSFFLPFDAQRSLNGTKALRFSVWVTFRTCQPTTNQSRHLKTKDSNEFDLLWIQIWLQKTNWYLKIRSVHHLSNYVRNNWLESDFINFTPKLTPTEPPTD